MKLKFLTLFSILALAASVFAESAMSNITVNLRYTGKNGAAKMILINHYSFSSTSFNFPTTVYPFSAKLSTSFQ